MIYALYTVHTLPKLYVPSAYPVVHYCSYLYLLYILYQEALAWRSMDDLQTYCTCKLHTQWYTTVHTCTYCTKKLSLGGAWMIYRHTVRTNCVPSGTLLFIPLRTVLYQRALAGRSTDDLQTYCTYQVRTEWFFYSYVAGLLYLQLCGRA